MHAHDAKDLAYVTQLDNFEFLCLLLFSFLPPEILQLCSWFHSQMLLLIAKFITVSQQNILKHEKN